MKHLKVEGHTHLYRDPQTNSIINKNSSEYDEYINKKFLREKESINLNRTYVIFGRNNVYKDKFQLVYYEISNAFKKINQMKV